jgi:hypothetical protein
MEALVAGSIGSFLVAFNMYRFQMDDDDYEEGDPYATAPAEIPHDDEYGCFASIQRRYVPVCQTSVPKNLLRYKPCGVSLTFRVMRTQSNHVIHIHSLVDTSVIILHNQRVAAVVVENCTRVTVTIVDSAVITSKTLRVLNCDGR